MQSHLRFAPEILARLGEELVPHADLGILELVRNAYDADAPSCTVKLAGASSMGGTLQVSDDGVGMTARQLAEDFLLLGKSAKSTELTTPGGRRMVGEKGLGRLAALRLGKRVEVRTVSTVDPGVAHMLAIDWDEFDRAEAVEDVDLQISSQRTEEKQGTTITISDLRQPITSQTAERLARALLLLTGPFRDSNDFIVNCDAPEFAQLAMFINDDYLKDREYLLVAELDAEGQASATLYNWRGEPEFTGDHIQVAQARTRGAKKVDVPERFFCPAARIELWTFNLNPSQSHELRNSQQDTEAIKKWLARAGGIHVYHRGLRVQPYGDRGNDWLGINLRRAASPEGRPSTNNSIGRILVEDPDDDLRPKTDRNGFVESVAFSDLQEFARRVLDWAADQRLHRREQRREGKAAKTRDRADEAEQKFRRLAELVVPPESPGSLPLEIPADRETVEAVINSALDTLEARKQETFAIREDLLLYRSLASVGTSTAVFAHESLRPSSRLVTEVQTIRRRVTGSLPPDIVASKFAEPLDVAEQSALTLGAFAKLPLSLLEKIKRSPSLVYIDEACASTMAIFSRFLDERDIVVELDLNAPEAAVWTTVADVESILSNLVANAAHALQRLDAPPRPRVIRIRSNAGSDTVSLYVDDSGPGIHDMPLQEIWLPGKSCRDDGTGLGLTIVRDIVADLKGRREAHAEGDLGGARIIVTLPTRSGTGSTTRQPA